MAIRLDPMQHLGPDAPDNILFKLSPQDLALCCQVSKGWRARASKDLVWIQVLPEIGAFAKVDIKKYIDRHAVISMERLADQVEKFARKVSSKGSFTCVFLFNPNCKIKIELERPQAWYVFPKHGLNETRVFIEACVGNDLLGNTQEEETPTLKFKTTISSLPSSEATKRCKKRIQTAPRIQNTPSLETRPHHDLSACSRISTCALLALGTAYSLSRYLG